MNREQEFFLEKLNFQNGSKNKWDGTSIWHGRRNGYEITSYRTDNVTTFFSIGAYHESPEANAKLSTLFTQLQYFKNLSFVAKYITFQTTLKAINKNSEEVLAELDSVLQFLSTNGFATGCFISGEQGALNLYNINGRFLMLTEAGIGILQSQEQARKVEIKNRNENFGLGFLAALAAAIVVGAIIVGIGQLGYRFYYLSVLMPIGIFGAYNFAAKKTSFGSRLFLTIFSIAATFGALYVDWAITLAKLWGVGLKDAIDQLNIVLFNPIDANYASARIELLGDAAVPVIVAAIASIIGFFVDMKKDNVNITKM